MGAVAEILGILMNWGVGKKPKGAERESQGSDPAEGAVDPPPLQPSRYLGLFENRKSQGAIKPSSRPDVWR